MKQSRRSFLKSYSATAVSATVFGELITTPGSANAFTPGTPPPPRYFVDCTPGPGYTQNPAANYVRGDSRNPICGKAQIWTTKGGSTGQAVVKVLAWREASWNTSQLLADAIGLSLSCDPQTGARTAASAIRPGVGQLNSGPFTGFFRISQWYDNMGRLRFLDIVITGTVTITDNASTAISALISAHVKMIETFSLPIVGLKTFFHDSIDVTATTGLEIKLVIPEES